MTAGLTTSAPADPLATLREYRALAPWGLRDLSALAAGLLDASGVVPVNAAARARPSERTIRFYVTRGLVSPPDGRGTAAVYSYRHLLKALAIKLRQLLADGVIGDMVFGHFSSIVRRLKTADDWRNDESMAGGDAFFEEGIHWLHLAASLGPRITRVTGFRPAPSRDGPDQRVKSMLVSFSYDNGAVGSLYYSREIPSLLKGLRLSKLMGRQGVITFESNGAIVLVRGRGLPRIVFPGFRDIRGYQAMYRDFRESIASGRAPEMSLERAMDDQRLMDQIYSSLQ